jgi:hypothetical protein
MIEPTGVRVAVLGQQQGTDQQQQGHHRHGDQQDRAPPEELQQHAAHQRTDRGPDRKARDPRTDGELALVRVVEHVADQGHRRWG